MYTPKGNTPLHFREPSPPKTQKLSDKYLKAELLRLKSLQRLNQVLSIWGMSQEQLCKFFLNYHLFPYSKFNKTQLLQANSLKLIKSQNRIYFGQLYAKKKSGNGILINKQGKIYQGHFQENQKKGFGVQIYPNGNLYIGQFANSKKHGKGTFFWFNIVSSHETEDKKYQYYQGDWWGGLPDGNGIHHKVNGDYYVGTFKNGLKHGPGHQQFSNGDKYKGQYVNGLPQGYGEYFWRDGSTYKGDMKQGLRNGYGVWKMGEGHRQSYKGHYSLDKKSGYGIYEWDNGWIYKGDFKEDLRHGFGELFHGGDLVYKGHWEDGQQRQYAELQIIQQKLPKIDKSRNKKHNSSTVLRSRTQPTQKKKIRLKSHYHHNIHPNNVIINKNRSHSSKKLLVRPSKKPSSFYNNPIRPTPHNNSQQRKCQRTNCGCNVLNNATSMNIDRQLTMLNRNKSPKSIIWRYET